MVRLIPCLMIALASFGLTKLALAARGPAAAAPVAAAPSKAESRTTAPSVATLSTPPIAAPCRPVRVIYQTYARADAGCPGPASQIP